MSTPSEYSGSWWLPENPENRIHGKLSYDLEKGTTLSLDGAFTEYPDNGNFYEIILGDSFGEEITLSNCLLKDFQESIVSNSNKRYKSSEFVITVFYVGCHFTKKEDIKFSQLSVKFSQLEEWLGKRLFKFERRKNEEGLREHILKLTMPNAKKIDLDKLKISIGYGFSTHMAWLKPKFEATVGVSIEVDDKMHIDNFYKIVYHIRNFLSLSTGNPISILSITGRNENIDKYKRIQMFYRKEPAGEELFSQPFFPIQYKSISEHLESYLQNWFDIVENVKPTYDLFFGTIYNPHLYLNHTFLSLAQALESYLNRTSDSEIMPTESFEDVKNHMLEIIGEIPEEYKQQFEPKVKSGMNRKSFRKKLKEMFKEEYSNLFVSFIDKKDEFIGKVVDTRNYYTHYSPELEVRAVKREDLPILSQNLRFILIVILLKEIGFNDKLIRHALAQYMRFRIRQIV